MVMSRRKCRIRGKMGDSDKKDIISSLPDEVLGRILSFLPTKHAVATSVLSSRWRNLYKLTTTLDFDDSVSLNHRKDLSLVTRNNSSFKEFVSRILSQCRRSNISKFRLNWGHDIEPRLLHDWMNDVFVHKLAEFDLSIGEMRMNCGLSFNGLCCENLVVLRLDCSLVLCVPNSVAFPCLKVLFLKGIMFPGSSLSLIDDGRCKGSSNYHGLNGILSGCSSLEELVLEGCTWNCELNFRGVSCENLVVLKLECMVELCVPNYVAFPSLKILFLKGILFEGRGLSLIDDVCCNKGSSNHHGLNGILFGCPLLEELVIEDCAWNGGDLYFTNPLLRSLTFHCGLHAPLDQLNGCTIYMDLPNLVYFDYDECLAEQYEIRNLKSIIEARIVICFNDDEFDDQQDLCNAILDLITGVCCCHTLNLSSHCLEALTSGDFDLPNFENMTHLQLALGHDVSWDDVLLDFLNCSSCLESLILVQGFLRDDCIQSDEDLLLKDEANVAFLLKDEVVPSCVRYRLRFIEIKEFRGFQGEMQMVRYFLDSANVLEEMVIHWDKRTRNIVAKEKEILELPKSSLSCSISFM